MSRLLRTRAALAEVLNLIPSTYIRCPNLQRIWNCLLDYVGTFTHVHMSSFPTPTHIDMIKNKRENLNK